MEIVVIKVLNTVVFCNIKHNIDFALGYQDYVLWKYLKILLAAWTVETIFLVVHWGTFCVTICLKKWLVTQKL